LSEAIPKYGDFFGGRSLEVGREINFGGRMGKKLYFCVL